MANSYNAGGKYFDINSADADVDGLNALKGADPASNDTVYISEGYRVTINRNCSLEKVYLGDNKAGDAATKTGHLTISASASNTTLTLFDTASHGGLTGEGTTSTITMTGVSDAIRAILTCNTVDKVTNYNIRTCKITSSWGKFSGLYAIYSGAANNCQNTIWDDCYNALIFEAAYGIKPESLDGCVFQGCVGSIYDVTTTLPIDWGMFFATNEVKFIGNTDGSSQNQFRYGSTAASSKPRFMYHRENAVSITTAPAWNTTTGIQSLTANKNATLTALWNTAAHGTGDTVGYRIYIRNGAAPDSFGISSAYFLAETTDASFVIACDAGGNSLAAGDTYYVVVRAATALSDEDSNTAVKNAEVVSSESEIIRRIDRVTGTILALTVSRE